MESVFLISLVRLEYTYVSLQIHFEIALHQGRNDGCVCAHIYLSFQPEVIILSHRIHHHVLKFI